MSSLAHRTAETQWWEGNFKQICFQFLKKAISTVSEGLIAIGTAVTLLLFIL